MRFAALISLLTVAGCSTIKADDVVPSAAKASANCLIPANLAQPKVERGQPNQTGTPQVTGYTLALSWSPQFCRGHEGDARHSAQCGTGKEFDFVLHGLWPEGEGKGDLAWCAPAGVLPSDIIRANFCASPSPQLLQHEWAKHGTCMTRDPALYFGRARALFESVKLPDMDVLSRGGTSVAAFTDAVTTLNPNIPARAINISTSGGSWLTEVKICYDSEFQPAACSQNRRQTRNRQRGGARLKIWRDTQ